MATLKNKYCCIEYRENDRQVFGRDLTDMMNEPAFFTKSKRGLKKAWDALTAAWNDANTMEDVIRFFGNNGIRTHYWCMVD